MGRLCTICCLPADRRQAVDVALLVHQASYRKIAQEFGVGEFALYRHEQEHLREQIRQHKELKMLASSESLMAELNRLHTYATWALDRAKASDDARTVLAGVDVAGRNVERLARIGPLGDIQREIDALKARIQHGQGDSYADE